MRELWNKNFEKQFFISSLGQSASTRQLFYLANNRDYLAYWPKDYSGGKSTLQSRNSLIGSYTEKWAAELIQEAVRNTGFFAVNHAVCEEVGLPKQSPADVVISTVNNINQKPDEIKAIFEVKMSIVWNWCYKDTPNGPILECIGDYKTHSGVPGLLRSDSMLKAIGKGINIRIANKSSAQIPIIILGNTPIRNIYYSKVDNLKSAGIIQGFLSINPNPLDNKASTLKSTPKKGFYKFDTFNEFKSYINNMLSEEKNYFSGMRTKQELGRIIEVANKETTYQEKANTFLKLIGE